MSKVAKNNWTEQQISAIETDGCNLLVAAAAGSGKTAVLVERIIKKVTNIEKPIDIDRLLVVTFTNAAASEMRERIGDAISRELDKNPDSKTFQRQLTLLPKASITTIHSFCLDVIRNNFHIINIDPNFRICDDTEAILLRQEAIEELFDSRYELDNNEEFLNLVECYGGSKSDEKLEEIVVGIYKFAESSPWPSKWLIDAAEVFNVREDFNFENSIWSKSILKSVRIEVSGLVVNMKRAVEIIEKNDELEVYYENFNNELVQLKNISIHSNITFSKLRDYINAINFENLKPCKNADPNLKKYATDIRNKVKDSIKKIQNNLMAFGEEKIREEMKKLYPSMSELSGLIIEFKKIYSDKKRAKSVIDFNDIEHYALEILTELDERGEPRPSAVAQGYRQRFEEVLVDEYQDSNMVQEVMLSMVSRTGEEIPNLFMVGDVKQSIYRFRQAMPELFLKKYNDYTSGSGLAQKITLYKNFRSRSDVVHGVNYIFKHIMSENIGELDYNTSEELNFGAYYPELNDEGIVGGPVELHIVETSKNDGAEDDEDEAAGEPSDEYEKTEFGEEENVDNIQLEARMIVKRIKAIVNTEGVAEFKVFDKFSKAYRKAEYKDIVILLRATRSWSSVFLEEFSRERIPAFADVGTGYFDTIEIKTMLSFLQVIDNPMQDIPLLGVLRSPVFFFTPEELIDIRLEYEKVSFYEALKLTADKDITGISFKSKSFLDKLKIWQEKSIHTPVNEFLWLIYMETGYFGYVSAMPGGVQRQANLKVLFERARQYEDTSYKGLFNFINFINRLKRNSGDMGSAKILGENENVVRIMSIHKSKGLEFPVVFVAGCGKGFNLMDLRGGILFHKELGYGPDYVDYKRRYSYPSTMKEAIRTRIRLETLSEEMRVLYVAFTRAKEKLIITGSVRNIDKARKRWSSSSDLIDEKLSEYEVLTSGRYLDWICPVVINHRDGGELTYKDGIIDKLGIDNNGAFEVSIWNRKMILEGGTETGNDEEIETLDLQSDISDSPYKDIVEKRLSFIYPYKLANTIPAKLSVSELKRAKNLELMDEYSVPLFTESVLTKPTFMETKEGLSAAEKGTVMHLVMQHLDFSKPYSRDEITEQIRNMVKTEILTEIEAKTANIKKLEGFVKSSLGNRIIDSKNVVKEWPFTVEIYATGVYKELPIDLYKDEKIMLQGVIDCFFEENGNYILIDYKTDYIEEGKTDIIKDKYKLQIDCYALALEKVTGKKVTEKYIYLFHNGQTLQY